MNIENKKVAFLGDSITQGAGVSAPDKIYCNVFAKMTNSIALNYGISGTRIAPTNMRITEADPLDFITRLDDLDPESELVVVFGGTNDFGHGDAPLGTFEDDTPKTFYGAMHTLCRKLIVKFPQSEIVFMTPLHRLGEDFLVNERALPRAPLSDYVNAIIEVCRYYSLPVLDLFANSGMQPAIDEIKDMYMPDGLHPSDLGAEKIAKRLAAFINSI